MTVIYAPFQMDALKMCRLKGSIFLILIYPCFDSHGQTEYLDVIYYLESFDMS